MGRTARKREKRRKLSSVNNSVNLNLMEDWMKFLGWTPVHKLTADIFPETGRGLKCLEAIEAGELLIKIPKNLLITTSSVCHTFLQKIFLQGESFDAQSVLAVFLCYQKHLNDFSDWQLYINSLPTFYTVPDYCTSQEKKLLPKFISQDLEPQSRKVVNQFKIIIKSIYELEKKNQFCPHCQISMRDIISFNEFKWGFYTVNTRAVYIDSKKNINKCINIRGCDNLALAPFLDLFNHSYDASVDVDFVIERNNQFYQIRTLKSYGKSSQAFINYGPHSSLKLYIEYGFFIPKNPLDEIYIEYSIMKKCFPLSENANEFIVSNNFDKNIGFTREGLNYNAKIVLFVVISSHLTSDYWKMKIFGHEDFKRDEIYAINNLGIELLVMKKNALIDRLVKMKCLVNRTESFKMAIALVEEYISLLNCCSRYLTKNIHNEV